ncbi:hypothetical protein K0M31_010879 [Melipona bicolor]|uniref:Uncharacterized protein n=1 Tax=Melipona bicolor TaxID=60889 RepID=A0AA40FL20_9HYME|nr:hypothetical protein K0M31_010879 [Melipona bicolor]
MRGLRRTSPAEWVGSRVADNTQQGALLTSVQWQSGERRNALPFRRIPKRICLFDLSGPICLMSMLYGENRFATGSLCENPPTDPSICTRAQQAVARSTMLRSKQRVKRRENEQRGRQRASIAARRKEKHFIRFCECESCGSQSAAVCKRRDAKEAATVSDRVQRRRGGGRRGGGGRGPGLGRGDALTDEGRDEAISPVPAHAGIRGLADVRGVAKLSSLGEEADE